MRLPSPKLYAALAFVFVLSATIQSCTLIGDIFKAGAVVGIIVVVIIVAIVMGIARMFRK